MTAHRDVAALMPFLHLPVQSASDRNPESHELRPHVATITAAHCRAVGCEPSASYLAPVVGLHRRAFPAKADADFAATLALDQRDRLTPQALYAVQIQPATPARPRPRCRANSAYEYRQGPSGFSSLQDLDCPPGSARSTPPASAALFDVLLTGPGRHPQQIDRPAARIFRPVHVSARLDDLDRNGRDHRWRSFPLKTNSLDAACLKHGEAHVT